jgi:hypothetical protein
VARDRALYTGFTLLAFVGAVVVWVQGMPPGRLLRPGMWRDFLSPLVTLPLAFAIVFAWRLIRKTGSFWLR